MRSTQDRKLSHIAIVTGVAGRPSETFITRHIKQLNGGNTVIVCSKILDDELKEFPHFILDMGLNGQSKSIKNILTRSIKLITHGHAHVPSHTSMKHLANFLHRHNVTAILAEFGRYGCIMQPVAEQMNLPIFTYFRGYDASRSINRWNNRYSYRRLIPKVDGIFSVSPHLIENLEKVGVKHPNVHVVPSGVETERFLPGEKDYDMLLSVGRLVKKKAPDITLKAFSRIAKHFPTVRLEMIGEGEMDGYCKYLVHELGLENRVKFLGRQPHEVIRKKLSEAAIFMLHSVTLDDGNTEGFPTAIQEAMSSGAVVVSTRHGGVEHFVEDGVTGQLVEEHDLISYSDAVINLLKNRKLLISISENSRKLAEKQFDSSRLLKKIEEVISSFADSENNP